MLKESIVATMSGVVKETLCESVRTSELINFGDILTVNFSSAGQSASGWNVSVFAPRRCHVPRINGVIFTYFAKSDSFVSILNVGAYGPDSHSYATDTSVAGLIFRLLLISGIGAAVENSATLSSANSAGVGAVTVNFTADWLRALLMARHAAKPPTARVPASNMPPIHIMI